MRYVLVTFLVQRPALAGSNGTWFDITVGRIAFFLARSSLFLGIIVCYLHNIPQSYVPT